MLPYSLQCSAICILVDPPLSALNMWPDIKSNMKEIRIDIVLRPRYETLHIKKFLCTEIQFFIKIYTFHLYLNIGGWRVLASWSWMDQL